MPDLPVTYAVRVTYSKPMLELSAIRLFLCNRGYMLYSQDQKWERWGTSRWNIDLPCMTGARDFPRRIAEFLSELAILEEFEQTGPLYDEIAQLIEPEIHECAECSAKPGSPSLCQRCLQARSIAGDAWKGPLR